MKLETSLRFDLFLKASRLIARRTLAQKLCAAGHVSLNGRPAKSSHAIKVGDEIGIRRHNALTVVHVLAVPTARQMARKDAAILYEVISEQRLDDDLTG